MSPTRTAKPLFDHVLTSLAALIAAWAVLAATVVASLAPLASLPHAAPPPARSAPQQVCRAP